MSILFMSLLSNSPYILAVLIIPVREQEQYKNPETKPRKQWLRSKDEGKENGQQEPECENTGKWGTGIRILKY